MALGGTASVRAIRDGELRAVPFTGDTDGLQAASDHMQGGKGHMFIGPGTVLTTAPIWVHSGTTVTLSENAVVKRSSMSNGDASASGSVFACGPYGSNGSLFTSGAPGSDISFYGGIVDGNESSFGSVTQSNLIPAGVWARYVDGIRIGHMKAQNCLGDGFRLEFCRNVYCTELHTDTVGQWGTSAARNAVNFIGDGAASGEWGYNYNLLGLIAINTGDEVIQCSNINGVTIVNVTYDGCDFVFECSPASGTTAGTFSGWSITNIAGRNNLDYPIAISQGQGSGYTLQDVSFNGCHFVGHVTLNDAGAIALPSTSGFVANGVSFNGCTFRNINTLDTAFHHWLDSQPADATGVTGLRLSACEFHGKSGSTRSGQDVGINLRGSHKDVDISGVLLKDVPGKGVMVSDTTVYAGTVLRDITVRGVMVDGCNDYAFRAQAASTSSAALITEVLFDGCTAKDSNKQTSGAAFDMFCDKSGATLSKFHLRGCRAYKTSGSSLTHGFNISRSAGTVDDVTLENCDFDGCQTGWINSVAGATNLRFMDSSIKGADVATATTAILGRGDVFTFTGTTQVDAITPFVAIDRRPITIIAGGLFVMSTGLGNITIPNVWVPKVGDTLTVRYDGTNWIEVTRSGMFGYSYQPTRSAELNLDSNVTMSEAQYIRVGRTVTVSGYFIADPTAPGSASFEFTLPIASNIGAIEDVAGVAFCGSISGQGAQIVGVAANDTAKVAWVAVDVTSQSWSYVMTYQVI